MRDNVSNLASAKKEAIAAAKRVKKAELGFEPSNDPSDSAANADLQEGTTDAHSKVPFYTAIVNRLLYGPSSNGPTDTICRMEAQCEAA